ncbi:hypothetical protein GQ44DRAFT_671597 [Phaeosphaeriaceae sp. PMI808]|nr:hypothetical protein GQ44DRAFT_671597 [Phaeosphaeriaceae sp. PMI808]
MSYSYSREATIAAVRDYYQFLTSMYLDEAKVLEPPEGGWPSIPVDGWPNFNKTKEVPDIHVAPDVVFADWQVQPEALDGEDCREWWSEPDADEAVIPAHIVGLALAQGRSPPVLLDTELGVIYWYECHGDIIQSFEFHQAGDAYGWLDDGLIDEDQVIWRANSGIWTIANFFENLKASFRKLEFVPLGPHKVEDMQVKSQPERAEIRDRVKDIYLKHGWPDMTEFSKAACSAEIKLLLEAYNPLLVES